MEMHVTYNYVSYLIITQSNLFNKDTKGIEPIVRSLQRCPYYRGRECMIFGISGTKQTVRLIEVSIRRG